MRAVGSWLPAVPRPASRVAAPAAAGWSTTRAASAETASAACWRGLGSWSEAWWSWRRCAFRPGAPLPGITAGSAELLRGRDPGLEHRDLGIHALDAGHGVGSEVESRPDLVPKATFNLRDPEVDCGVVQPVARAWTQ